MNPKYKPYRNKKILQLAKGQPCQHCGNNDGTTVACHSNLIADGKGVGKKSDDCFVAYLCSKCHRDYDSKTPICKSRADKQILETLGYANLPKITQEDFDRAMKRTMKIWIPLTAPTE